VLNSRLFGSDFSLLFSRCRDLRAVTPSKAALENLMGRKDRYTDDNMLQHVASAFRIS